MMLLLLGLLDIIASILMLIPNEFSGITFLIGLAVFFKGVLSIFGSALCDYFLDFMGCIDMAAGICICMGIAVPFLWFILFIKGMFSILSSAGN